MIKLLADEPARILIVDMRGMVSEADIDGAIEAFQESYPQVGVRIRGGERGGFSILADWQQLEGWEKGAKTLGTLTMKMIGDAVRKIAVVADDRHADELPRLSDVAKNADVRLFSPYNRAAAIAWLESR